MYFSVLLGNPVEHSISPKLFSLLADDLGIEYAHIKMNVPSKNKLPVFLNSLKNIGCYGINITLPYKIAIMGHVDAIEKEAKQMGAVNAIYFKNGKFIGFNADAPAALMAIEKKLKTITARDKVLILGAGGAGRAIAFEIRKRTSHIIIVDKEIKKAKELSDNLEKSNNILYKKFNNKDIISLIKDSDYIINASPVGMTPNIDGIPVDFSSIKSLKGKYFFDAIFNPYETKFLKLAKKKGAMTCSGMYMMIFQAAYVLEKWINRKVKINDLEKINSILIDYLKNHA